MRMVLSRRLVLLPFVVGVSLGAAACGGGGGGGEAPGDAAIVATTSIWADITSNVACGEPVEALIPAGADPHSYEPSLRDRELVSGASLIVANGAGLEVTTHDLLVAAIADGVNVVEVATHIDLLDDDEHDHGDGDPHVWQDPTRVAGALDVIASALTPAGFRTCGETYREELLALDTEISAILANIPDDERILVTSHDSLAYFADRYGFEVVGTVIASTSTMAESSAGELAELAELVEERSVRAIFTDALESASDAEALADRIGVPVVPLVTDAVTDEAPTYAAMMRSNATTIAEALAP